MHVSTIGNVEYVLTKDKNISKQEWYLEDVAKAVKETHCQVHCSYYFYTRDVI